MMGKIERKRGVYVYMYVTEEKQNTRFNEYEVWNENTLPVIH